jgi:hypothetical protein
MDTLNAFREAVRDVLSRYLDIRYAFGEIRNEAVFDEKNDRYLVVSVGWDPPRRVHSCLLHVDIQGDKVWIQEDNTEDGIARELEEAGIPKKNIVLGFREPEVRPYTEYAAA